MFVKPDIPFSREDAHRLLPWIIAFILCLTSLLLAFALSLNQSVRHSSESYTNLIQVEVPYLATGQQPAVEKVMAELKSTPKLENLRILERSEMQDLVTPWLGADVPLEDLPLPTLIEVQLETGASLDAESLQRELQVLVPGTNVSTHQQWMHEFSQFARAMQIVSFGMAFFMLVCGIAVVILAARTSLKLHYKTINILHLVGAKDDYIIRQFEWNGLGLVLKGALTGTVMAAAMFMMVVFLTQGLDSPLLPALSLTREHMVLFVVLPLLTTIATLLAIRTTIQSMLQSMH